MMAVAFGLPPFACAAMAQSGSQSSTAETASALPLAVPGFEDKPQLPAPFMPQPEAPAAKTAECAVNADQLPPEFLNLMGRLNEPVRPAETGLPPVVDEVAPAVAAQARNRASRARPAGVQVLSGSTQVQRGQSRENGVTVYRGVQDPVANKAR